MLALKGEEKGLSRKTFPRVEGWEEERDNWKSKKVSEWGIET